MTYDHKQLQCVVQCDIFRGTQGYNLGNEGKYGGKIKISVLSFKLTFLPAKNSQIYRSKGIFTPPQASRAQFYPFIYPIYS